MPCWEDEPVTFDNRDTLHSAQAKLNSASSGRPSVVLASDCRLAGNVLTYRMLARASERFGSPIYLVAGNPHWRQMAREHGLRAYPSVGSLRRARGRSIISLPESLADSLLCSLHLSIAGFLVLATLLLAGGATAYLTVPVMRVTITTSAEVLDREISVRVAVGAEAVDLPSTTIPGRVVERRFSVSDIAETTGKTTVFNSQTLAGGTDARARTVSAEDRDRAKETLLQLLQAQALEKLAPGVRQSESLIPHSLHVQVESVEYDQAVGDMADRLKGTVHGSATGIVFANRDLNSLVEQEWIRSPPNGYRALTVDLKLSPPEVVKAAPLTAELRVQVSGQVQRVLEIDELAQGLRATPVEQAKARLARLERPLMLESIQMWPEWAPIADRVEVQLVR